MDDSQYIIKELEAHHIQHAVSMAEDAGMKPNAFNELDFFRTNSTSEFVGLFSSNGTDIPIGVAGLLHDEERDYFVLLIVNKEHRKKGIGKKLVQWAIDTSRKEERTKVLQLVASKMGSPLYKSLGFVDSGYTNMYEISVVNNKVKSGLDSSRREISSFKLADIAMIQNGQEVWHQAKDMLMKATSSEARTERLVSLLEKSTIHLLYVETGSSKPSLKAWTAIRRYSSKSNVIGPLISQSVDEAIQLVQSITNKGSFSSNEDSLVIHTDGQSGQEPKLAKALETGGWNKVITLEVLELPLSEEHVCPVNKDNGARQFALTDFSHQ
jgi:GNAT superfamily N-acetyltransferase